MTKQLRIIIPAYNEANRIEPTLRSYCAYFGSTANITVVLNGCTDGTEAIVRRCMFDCPNLSVLNVPAPIGKGGAVRLGFMSATEPYVGFTDADGSFSPTEFRKLFDQCTKASVDGAIASRYLPGAKGLGRTSPLRRVTSVAFKAIRHAMFNLDYRDTQCGAKVFRRAALQRALPDLELANFAFDVDLLFQLSKDAANIVEVPVTWEDRDGSSVNFLRTSMSMFFSMLRLRLRRSPFRHVPYLDMLARQSVIRVARNLRILLLSDAGAGPDRQQWTDDFLAQWRKLGYEAEVWPRERSAMRATAGARLWARVAFLFWYTFGSSRDYDALVEVKSDVPYLLPCVSVKTTCLVNPGHGAGSEHPLYKALYRRVPSVVFAAAERGAAACGVVRSVAVNRGIYSASIFSNGASTTLAYADRTSGRRVEQAIPQALSEVGVN